MFNIINKFLKNIITIEKNHRFDLKDKIKNYFYCCRHCYSYYYYDY
jgi:hypothetical protein